MAERSGQKKVRIRKTAPTIRERVEIEKVKAETPSKKSLIQPKLAPIARPLKRVKLPKLPENRVTRILKRVSRIIFPRYFVNSWKELKQVTWPSRRETWRLTGAVIIFAIIFGAMVAALDKVLDILFKNLVLK